MSFKSQLMIVYGYTSPILLLFLLFVDSAVINIDKDQYNRLRILVNSPFSIPHSSFGAILHSSFLRTFHRSSPVDLVCL